VRTPNVPDILADSRLLATEVAKADTQSLVCPQASSEKSKVPSLADSDHFSWNTGLVGENDNERGVGPILSEAV
jgi:hypothetical protein